MSSSKTKVNNRIKHDGPGDYLFYAIAFFIFGIFTIICLYPFYYLIINSISSNDLSANGQIMFYPRGIHFDNYFQVVKLPGLMQSAFISVSRTIIGTITCVLTSAFLGFMFTQEKMWARKFWYRFTIITMYINAGVVPWYLTMHNLHLTNNFLIYVLPGMVGAFNIILVKTYVESTPKALQEAAEIDGAGTLRVFAQIILPICMPILATLAIFCAVGAWNDFQTTLIAVTNQKLFPLQMVLYQYINQASSLASMIKNSTGVVNTDTIQSATKMQTPQSVQMTVSVIVVLPILLVYPFFQKYFVKGIMIGSVKG